MARHSLRHHFDHGGGYQRSLLPAAHQTGEFYVVISISKAMAGSLIAIAGMEASSSEGRPILSKMWCFSLDL